jgi:hypothetical protein
MVERLRKSLDVIEHVRSGDVARPVGLAADPLGSQQREEALMQQRIRVPAPCSCVAHAPGGWPRFGTLY